jgi:hypothetical protein
MGNVLDIVPGIVANTVGQLLFKDAVLTAQGAGTGPSYDPTPGTPVDYPCRALATNWSNYSRANGLVAAEDRKILIQAQGLGVVPKDGMSITIDGESFVLVSDGGSAPAVRKDPSTAVWTCRGRG